MMTTMVLLNLVCAFFITLSSFFLASYLCHSVRLKKTLIPLSLILVTHFFFLIGILHKISLVYCPWYVPFLFLLSVTLYTDTLSMCISRFCTLYPLPICIALSALISLICKDHYLPLSLPNSLIGIAMGLSIGYTIAYFGKKYAQQEALGQGDIDLLMLIGFFLGTDGIFKTLCYGSILGSLYGILYSTFINKKYNHRLKLPFGTFLSYGVFIYLIFI